MGIETGTAILFSTLIATSAQIFGGVVSKQAADDEALLLEEQGALARLEANEEADRINTENIKFRKKQKLAFLKSGVGLIGSPLLILEETRTEGNKEVEAIRRRGQAQFTLGLRKAGITRATGRARLIGGIAGAASSAVSGFSTFGTSRLTSQPGTSGAGVFSDLTTFPRTFS